MVLVLQIDVFEYIRSAGYKYSLIFAGPPYALPTLNQIPGEIFEAQLLEPGGWLILEHNPNHDFSQHPYYKWQRNYGTTFFAIFEQP